MIWHFNLDHCSWCLGTNYRGTTNRVISSENMKAIQGRDGGGFESGGCGGGGNRCSDSGYTFKVVPKARCLKFRHK